MPRAFLCTLVGVNALLTVVGVGYARYGAIPRAVLVPVFAALALQISFYLVPGFPEVRRILEEELPPSALAAGAVALALLPYLIYSVPTGVFSPLALLEVAALSAVPAVIFVLWPTRSQRLTLQDVAVLGTVAVAVLGKVLRAIYVSPLPNFRLAEQLGRFMMILVVATAFLSLRKLEGSGYQFAMSAADWRVGIKNFLLFLPFGAAVGVGIRFIHYQPVKAERWQYPLIVLGGFWVALFAIALFEELLFRGVLQNLLTETLGDSTKAQALASMLFGLSHITFRSFPNWNFVIMATIAGWFCGRAYRERQSVVASSITHALVITVWRVFFTG
jgi:membrane protease YdiL (CAAX protease family)